MAITPQQTPYTHTTFHISNMIYAPNPNIFLHPYHQHVAKTTHPNANKGYSCAENIQRIICNI